MNAFEELKRLEQMNNNLEEMLNDWEIYLSKHYNEIIKTFEEQTIQQYQNALNEKIKAEKLNNQNLTDLYNKLKENV